MTPHGSRRNHGKYTERSISQDPTIGNKRAHCALHSRLPPQFPYLRYSLYPHIDTAHYKRELHPNDLLLTSHCVLADGTHDHTNVHRSQGLMHRNATRPPTTRTTHWRTTHLCKQTTPWTRIPCATPTAGPSNAPRGQKQHNCYLQLYHASWQWGYRKRQLLWQLTSLDPLPEPRSSSRSPDRDVQKISCPCRALLGTWILHLVLGF